MKSFIKFFGIIMIIVSSFNPVHAQSPTGDTTKSATAAGAPASNDPSINPTANNVKPKSTDASAYSDNTGKWGLLGLLGLLGLFGLRRNDRNK